jgi:hypothetical protein
MYQFWWVFKKKEGKETERENKYEQNAKTGLS